MNRVWLRWIPAVAVPALVIAGAFAAQAATPPTVPAKTPTQVLAMVVGSSVKAVSGTVEETSDLGLPQLPDVGGSVGGGSSATPGGTSASDISSYLTLLTGSHTARVYLDGRYNERVQMVDSFAETDVIRHGNDLWVYNSKKNTATHVTLPVRPNSLTAPAPGALETPQQAAQHFLSAVTSTTAVTLGDSLTVAGRSAYDLVLTPRPTDTLVGSVSVAVDSKTGLPLRVTVLARTQKSPAFQVGFTSISYQTPAADLFTFTPPPGATVKQQKLPQSGTALGARPQGNPAKHVPSLTGPGSASTPSTPTVIGTSWDAVVEVPASDIPASVTTSPLFSELTSPVSDGRVFSTALVNVLLTSDGRAFIGSVPISTLQAAAAGR